MEHRIRRHDLTDCY